jgi:hypothetical protein
VENELRSFAVGASLNQGAFMAFLLKLKFEDGRETLTAWEKPQVVALLQMLLEYQKHLHRAAVHLDPDSIEEIVHGQAPKISLSEIESLPVHAVVETAAGHVQSDNVLAVSFKRARQEKTEFFHVVPNQCEWLIGFIANTLNEFSEDGELDVPNGTLH